MIPKDSCTFDPFDLNDLDRINAALKHNRLAEIPSAYVDFLTSTNGLIFRDLELYGTSVQMVKERFFSFPDIVGYNKRYTDHPFLIQKLILGQNSHCFIIYDAQKKNFVLADRISFQPVQTFENFDALMKTITID